MVESMRRSARRRKVYLVPEEIPERFAAELMDQAEYLDRIESNQQIQAVMVLDGRIDRELLARAVRLTLDAEPIMGCRFVERLRPYWQRRQDLDHLELVSVAECATESDASDALMEFLTAAGDPRHVPLVRVKVLRADSDTISVKVDHIAADTGGTRDYLYLLCDTYNRLVEDPGYRPLPNAAGDRSLNQVLGRFSLTEKARSLRHGFPPRPAWGFPWKGGGQGDYSFAIRRMPEESFRALEAYGKGHQATINDCLLAAYYRAFFEIAGTPPGTGCTVLVPIDLRRNLPEETAGAICNLSGQLYPVIAMKRGEGFAGTVERVRDAMGVFKAHMPGIGAAIGVAAVVSPGVRVASRFYGSMIAAALRSGRCNPYLSNMGRLSPERLDFAGAPVKDAYLVSPLMSPPGFLVGASSFADRLTLTIGYAGAGENRETVERLLDLLEKDLLLYE